MALLLDEPALARRRVDLLELRGGDRLGYLHTLTTQHFEAVTAGTAADYLHLDPKGNAQSVGRALVGGEAVVLVVPDDLGEPVRTALERFRFALDVPIAELDGWAMASVRGGRTLDVPDAPAEPLHLTEVDGGLVVRDRSGGVDLVGPAAWLQERVDALGLPEADREQWDAYRILAGEPAWGSEITPGRRPQELGLLPTHVHLRKGCYPGQESVAKMYNLGRPRRALAVVELDEPVEAGTAVATAHGEGTVTSVARADARVVALALLPLDDGHLPEALTGPVPGRVLRRVGEGLEQPGAAAPIGSQGVRTALGLR